jgi:hypothetical protein
MSDDQQPEERPGYPSLREALEDWKQRRAPKDAVRRAIPDDAQAVPAGPATTYSIAEPIEDADGNLIGMRHEEGSAFISPAIYSTEQLQQRREERERNDNA